MDKRATLFTLVCACTLFALVIQLNYVKLYDKTRFHLADVRNAPNFKGDDSTVDLNEVSFI